MLAVVLLTLAVGHLAGGEVLAQTTPTDATTTTVIATTSAPPTDGQPRIVTTLRAQPADEPVEGVEMVVSIGGDEIGRAASDATGFVAVSVPGAGQYDVELDGDTLPDGTVFVQGAPQQLRPIVQPTGDRPVVFQLTTAEGGVAADTSPSSTERMLDLFASGLRFGAVIAMAAVGLSLVFGTTGLTNFAHGEMVAFGAIVAWYLNADEGGLGLPLVVAAVGAIIASGVFGAAFELGVYRQLRRRGMPILAQMVVSIGLAFALRYLFLIVYGAGPKQYSQFAAQAPTVHIGPVDLRPKDVIATIVALGVLVIVGVFLQRARLGTAIRAVSDNHDLSAASGIDTQRVILRVWILAGTLAGLGGVVLGTTDTVQWSMGQRVLLVMFAAVVLGGLGTPYGAMVGGLFVGIVSDLSTYWLDSDLKIVVALATLIAVLLIRPQGIFGVRARTA